MSEMDDLFALARVAALPPVGAKARVLARVLSSVPPGPGGGGGGAATAPAPAITAGGAVLASAIVFALAGLLGGGLYLARTRHTPEPAPIAEYTAPTIAPVTLPPVVTLAPAATPSAIVDLDTPQPTRPAPSVAVDTLAEELVLIRSAQSSLGAGNATGALQTLDQHAQRFPRGKLAQEREVTRVRALCRAGRTSEARGLYRALAKGAPSSPHLASLRASCPGLAED